MKNLFLSTCLSVSLLCSSCTNFNSSSVKPLVNATVLVAANKYAQKNPDNVGKILDLAELLDLAADTLGNALSKQDFVDLVSKVDVEWSVLGVVLYDIYAQNVTIPEQYSKHAPTLRELATTLRDAVLFVTPAK